MTQEDLYRLWYKSREEYWQNAYAGLMEQFNTYKAPLLAEIERLRVAYDGTWAGVEALQRTVASLKEEIERLAKENRELRNELREPSRSYFDFDDIGCTRNYVDFQGLSRDCTQYEGCGLPGCWAPLLAEIRRLRDECDLLVSENQRLREELGAADLRPDS